MEDLAPDFNVEEDLFSFETDHLALKGNEDYCNILKTLVILTAQRERALQDYKTISEKKLAALNSPFETLEMIKNGDTLDIPPLMELPKLPRIDFQKYKVKVPESDLQEIYSEGGQLVSDKPEIKTAIGNTWAPEEQKRLEELLQVYPPEPIEMRRFQKIAKALGNRTVHQVASRIQKYFVKLYKAGLPIPGRIPKSAEKFKKSALHRHQRHNHYLWKPSTFFPELNLPVQMEDLNSIPGPSDIPITSINTSTDNYLIRNNYQQNENLPENTEPSQELQLKLLKRVRDVKLQEESEGYVPFSHVGFICDYCDDSPISGTRWHCTVCPESADFCTDCVVSQMYSEAAHPLSHWFALYRDDSELDTNEFFDDFSEPTQEYDKQITDELKNRQEERSEDSDYDGSD